MDKLFRRSPIDLPIETNRSRGRAQVVYRSLKPVVTRSQGDGCDGVDTESCSLSPASISSLSFSTRVGGCAVVSQPPLSFISACTRVVSSPLVLHPSPYFLPLLVWIRSKVSSGRKGRERERERQGTRAFQLNRFPWVFRGLQVPRNRRTRPGTHDQYVGEVGGLLQRPPPVLPSSPPWTPSLSHVCEEDYYYVHVCARLSPPPARVFRGTLADLSLSATRGNCVTRRNWSTGDVRSTSLFVLCWCSCDNALRVNARMQYEGKSW